MKNLFLLPALLLVSGIPVFSQADPILAAMQDELQRSRALKIVDLDPPYFISYALDDADGFSVSASLGGLMGTSHRPLRVLDVQVRVGSFDFDNTNYVFSGMRGTGGGPESPLPMDNNIAAIRQSLWLATDNAFKTAEEAISRKRSALKNVTVTDPHPDFSKAPVVESLQTPARRSLDDAAWQARTVKLSKTFLDYPKITSSSVDLESIQSTSYLANSEGTRIRQPNGLAYVRVRARAQAPDGSPLRNAEVFQALEASDLPSEQAMQEGTTRLAGELSALVEAPVGENYDGPVLFEPLAAAQLFGQLLGDNLKVTRKPVEQPGFPVPHQSTELEGRLGARILPDWMDVVDDPSQTNWHGQPLFGSYVYDDEGVKAAALPLVESGVLKNFLLTRTPVLNSQDVSNGRGRLHGRFGAAAPSFGNLFVRASKTVTEEQLKAQLIAHAKERGKAYGILIRKLDYPSSASLDELRRTFAAAQSGGNSRAVSVPLLVYRVYPDGREELVRGLRFRDVSTRSLKDILAASDQSKVFSFLDNTFPFALMGVPGFISPSSVISPAILVDDIGLERMSDDVPKLPVVPPPSLRAER